MGWWLVALWGCASEEPEPTSSPAGECAATCAEVTTSPLPDATVGSNQLVWVQVEPGDYAFDARLYGPDGAELAAFVGSGYAELDAGPLADGPHELVVSTSCGPAPAPPCFDEVVSFIVDADAPTTMPGERLDAWTVEVPLVDMVLVLDDSSSMETSLFQQRTFAQSFITLALQPGVRLGIVTTTPTVDGDFVGPGWLTVDTPDVDQVAQQILASIGFDGTSDSTGLTTSRAAVEASEPVGANEGFARPDARLAVVVVSDNDDYGMMTAEEWVDWAQALGRPQLHFRPVVHQDGQDFGAEYVKAADALSQPSFDFDDLGDQLALDVLDPEWFVPEKRYCTLEPADPDTLRVELVVDTENQMLDQGVEWELVENGGETCVELMFAPLADSELRVSYLPAG